jgi:hypothetical protein
MSVKPEVKDKLFRLNKDKISFTKFTEEAIKINNQQFKRKQERKAKKTGTLPKFHPQANQSKKQSDYIAKDNGTQPGRIDINTINHQKFPGTCNAYGKKGHKEADCRSKMTCGFCGKKGHNEAHCYTKKNAKKSKPPKDKVQIDTITEVPHDHLSWTAYYNDLCLMHKSSKEGSGYYPKKSQAKKSHEIVRINTLNFYEKSHQKDFDCNSCEEYETNTIEYEYPTTKTTT